MSQYSNGRICLFLSVFQAICEVLGFELRDAVAVAAWLLSRELVVHGTGREGEGLPCEI